MFSKSGFCVVIYITSCVSKELQMYLLLDQKQDTGLWSEGERTFLGLMEFKFRFIEFSE